jgi:trans-aconitate 2-methyltransferase
MADWNPEAYLQFEKERSRPALDLAMRIEHDHPQIILDVGCGPGNSTDILYKRWKSAGITGIDNSRLCWKVPKNKPFRPVAFM